jgi:hypothetical protein
LNPRPDDRLMIDGILTYPWVFRMRNVFTFGEEPMVNFGFGGSYRSNLRFVLKFTSRHEPQTSFEIIFEDQGNQETLPTRLDLGQRRSISRNATAMVEATEPDGVNVHHAPAISQTISSQDPEIAATRFESTLVEIGITY